MVDPIVSGAGKASTELFKEAGKQMQNASEQVSKFEELRNKMEAQEMSGTNKAGQNNLQIEQTDKAKEAQATQQLNPVEHAQKTGEIPKVTDMSSLQQVVDRIKDGQSRLNNLIKESTSGKTYSPQEMIGLQAEISAITTDIQLCSKVVEQGVAGVKQMLQMQV
jgi:DNA-binding transcriptional regulator YdaS (Cro superfamily)